MKKIILIVTVVFYLFLSVGIRMTTHYCGDKISSVDFFFDKGESCCGKAPKKCCKDKISYLKLSDNHKQAPALSYSAPDFSEAFVPAIDYSRAFNFRKPFVPVYIISFFNSDIPLKKNPVYIVNRSFRV